MAPGCTRLHAHGSMHTAQSSPAVNSSHAEAHQGCSPGVRRSWMPCGGGGDCGLRAGVRETAAWVRRFWVRTPTIPTSGGHTCVCMCICLGRRRRLRCRPLALQAVSVACPWVGLAVHMLSAVRALCARRARASAPRALAQHRTTARRPDTWTHPQPCVTRQARGPAVVRRYWKQEEDATSADGWFSTVRPHGPVTVLVGSIEASQASFHPVCLSTCLFTQKTPNSYFLLQKVCV